jgi:hypothetical protein
LRYTDELKTDIEQRYKTDKNFYSLLSLAMSMLKLVMDKKPGQKELKDNIKKLSAFLSGVC